MGAGGGSAGDGGAGGGAVTVTRGAVCFFMTRPAVGAGLWRGAAATAKLMACR